MFPRALHYFLFHSATLVRHFAQSFLETHRNHSWGSIACPVMSDDVSQILLLFQMASCLPSCASLSSCLQCCLGGVPRGSAVVGGGFCILPCCRHGGDVGFPFETRFSQPFQEMSQLLPAAIAQVSGELFSLACFSTMPGGMLSGVLEGHRGSQVTTPFSCSATPG